KFPSIEVNIVLEATSPPIAALLDGQIDVAVTSCPPRNKSLRFTQTCEDELVIVMGSHHRLAASTHMQPRDLAGESVFCYPPGEECSLVLRLLRPAGLQPSRVPHIPLTYSLVAAVFVCF